MNGCRYAQAGKATCVEVSLQLSPFDRAAMRFKGSGPVEGEMLTLSLRRRGHPLNWQAKFCRLMLDPCTCFLGRSTDLHRRHALERCSAHEGGYEFIVTLRLDPGEHLASLRHRRSPSMTLR
jgi:hypothetical protein